MIYQLLSRISYWLLNSGVEDTKCQLDRHEPRVNKYKIICICCIILYPVRST